MDWYLVIRTAKIQLLQEMFPSRPVELVQQPLMHVVASHCIPVAYITAVYSLQSYYTIAIPCNSVLCIQRRRAKALLLVFQIRESVTRDFTFTGYLCKMPPDHSVSNQQLALFWVTHYVSPFFRGGRKDSLCWISALLDTTRSPQYVCFYRKPNLVSSITKHSLSEFFVIRNADVHLSYVML